MIECKKCGSEEKSKNGKIRGKQRYLCKECGCAYIEGDRRTSEKIKAKKSLIILLYGLGSMSIRMIAKILGTWPSLVSYWLVEAGAKLPANRITDNIKEVEIDEMWHFVKRKNKVWVLKARDRATKKTIAWVIGKRDTNTVRKLYNKLKHLRDCVFYTDHWDAFSKVLPPSHHIIGKMHTLNIECDNSNTRHHLARFTCRTKVVSKSVRMIDLSLRILSALSFTDFFSSCFSSALSIFL